MNDSLRDTIEPKSDQLNADDLITGPLTVRVENVKRGTTDQPVEIAIAGHRPFRPCKSMRRVLIAAWGDHGKDWIGKSMTLYCDPDVRFGGVAVGGIRISHLSDIPGEMKMMLTTTRSKRAGYVVKPLTVEVPDYPEADFEANVDAWVAAIKDKKITVPDLLKRINTKGVLSTEQRERLERAAVTLNKGEGDK